MTFNEEPEIPIEIPFENLSAVAFESLVSSFILREGTDYGAEEISLETKMKQVKDQITQGLLKIIFDQTTQTVTLIPKLEFQKKLSEGAKAPFR